MFFENNVLYLTINGSQKVYFFPYIFTWSDLCYALISMQGI